MIDSSSAFAWSHDGLKKRIKNTLDRVFFFPRKMNICFLGINGRRKRKKNIITMRESRRGVGLVVTFLGARLSARNFIVRDRSEENHSERFVQAIVVRLRLRTTGRIFE